MMKKLLLALCLLLCLTMAAPALAENTATYPHTQAALDYMDENDITYIFSGLDEEGDELVYIQLENSEGSFMASAYFYSSMDLVQIYVWNIIEYDPANVSALYEVCNDFNMGYRVTKFYVDTNTASITEQYDLVCHYTAEGKEDFVTAFADCVYYLNAILENAYPTLAPYAIIE